MWTRIVRALFETSLRAVPEFWRDSVRQDLLEEGGARRWIWKSRHAIAIGWRIRVEGGAPGARPSWTSALRGTATDLRYAVRRLYREPGWSIAVVLTLAIGIGAVTAAHAIFDFALFRPVPGVADEDRIVSIYFQIDRRPTNRAGVEIGRIQVLRNTMPALTGLSGDYAQDLPFSSSATAPPQLLSVVATLRDYFQVLGAQPRVGRLFASDEYESPSSTAVISERLWRQEYGADPSAIGRQILVNGDPFEIVGVVRAYLGPTQMGRSDIWLPAGARHTLARNNTRPDRWPYALSLIGRLRPSATIEQVRSQADAAWQVAGPIRDGSDTWLPGVFSGLTNGIGDTRSRLLAIYRVLIVGVVMLFLLACANAANLLLARFSRRSRELSLRSALGAGRGRLVRECLSEAWLLALAAAVAGIAIGAGLLQFLRTLRLLTYLPVLTDLAIDWRVAGLALLAAPLTTALFGAAPAFMAARAQPLEALRGSGRATTRGSLVRVALVCLQLALSLSLVIGAALFVETVSRLRAVDLGMEIRRVFAFSVQPNRLGYDDAKADRTVREIIERLRARPGVEAVTTSYHDPLSGGRIYQFKREGYDTVTRVRTLAVAEDYFKTLDVQIIAGRDFDATEARAGKSALTPLVVSDDVAKQVFGNDDPIGQRLIEIEGPTTNTYLIVGVAANVRTIHLRTYPYITAFEPLGSGLKIATIAFRTQLSGQAATGLVRETVQRVDPALPVINPRWFSDDIDFALSEERVFARVGIMVAGCAVGLAVAGLYALIAFFVSERTREFGVRVALGASKGRIAGDVLRRVLLLCGVGFAAGIALTVWGGRYIAARLFGVTPLDIPIMTASIVGLAAVALIAAWVPARRAAAVDPVTALRADG